MEGTQRGALESASEDAVVVLLGCPLDECPEASTVKSERSSKIGGEPCLPDAELKRLLGKLAPCNFCEVLPKFVAQVFAPVEEEQTRTLYLFVCTSSSCDSENAWQVLRYQKDNNIPSRAHALEKDYSSKQNNVSSFAWADGKPESTDIDMDELSEMIANLENKQKHGRNKKKKEKRSLRAQTGQMDRGILIEVFEESNTESMPGLTHIQSLLEEYNKEQRQPEEPKITLSGSEYNAYGKTFSECEQDSDSDAADEDPVAQNFQARLEVNPSQCLRYAYGGAPLFPNSATLKRHEEIRQKVPLCETCGSRRAFELQLMPGFIWYLQKSSGNESQMDWSSVLVYSCSSSCSDGEIEFAVALPPA